MHSHAAKPDQHAEASANRALDNPFERAIDAVGMGTWDWDIRSGRVAWTPRTYQLFGFEPDAFVTSYDSILQIIHEDDRPAVLRASEQAVRDRLRTMLEFRVVRADGTVRWLRSTGRAMTGDGGQVVRVAGVIDDITDEKDPRASPLAATEPPDGGFLSVRQVSHILGVSDVTLKRMAAAGEIEFLRSSRKDSRRFAPEQLIQYLQKNGAAAGDFASAARASDVRGCLVVLLQRLLDGVSIETLLDNEVAPVARVAERGFMAELLARIPFLLVERRRTTFPALVVRMGSLQKWHAELVGCLLRSQGHEVLSPADNAALPGLADMAERLRARIVVLIAGEGWNPPAALSVAADVARSPRAPAVCLWSADHVRSEPGVRRIRSLRDLGSVLRAL